MNNLISENARCRMVDSFMYGCEHLGDWTYTKTAIEKIIDVSAERKSILRNVLSKHPNWNEAAQMIHFDADVERPVNDLACGVFRDYLSNRARFREVEYQKVASDETTDTPNLIPGEKYENVLNLICALVPCGQSNLTSEIREEEVAAINDLLKKIERTEKLKVVAGQKRSKAVSKIFRALGYTDHESWDKEYPKFGDAISPMKIKRHTAISINAADFLMSSNGTDWSSCHNPDCETYEGQNCAGVLSYALDTVTICMYTVTEDYDSETLEQKPKFNRMMIYVSPDFKHFITSKCYPEASVGGSLREIFENVFAECLGVPNYWAKNNTDLLEYIKPHDYNCAYEDWSYQDRNDIAHIFHKSVPEDERINLETIIVGAKPICIECGSEYYEKGSISCCSRINGGKDCDNCGYFMDYPEDDEVYSEYHGEYGCRNCMQYCSYSDDWFYNDEFEYVSDLWGGTYVAVPTIENNGDDFYYCEYCCEWHYYINSDSICDTPDGYMCSYGAIEAGFRECPDCGEWFRGNDDDMIEVDGELYCRNCAESHLENQAS